jgi:NAD+ kinase
MRVGVHGKEFNKQSVPFIESIFETLAVNRIDIVVSSKFQKILGKFSAFRKFKRRAYEPGDSLKGLQLFLSLGGDGTLLESVTHIARNEVPILGINTGRLGFLATISREETQNALDMVLERKYTIEKRSMLKLGSNQNLFEGFNFALNDFTVVKKDTSSMITVHTYIDGEFLNSYWSDGIIVATPTGSTGYSLSCGGPVVFPHSGNFVITPISPHNLTVRPIVVSDRSEITFQVEGRSKKFLVSLDSRMAIVDESIRLVITKAEQTVHLVQLPDHHYFSTLRQKLNWGLDIRN